MNPNILKRGGSILSVLTLSAGLSTVVVAATGASAETTAAGSLSNYSYTGVNAQRLVKVSKLGAGSAYTLTVPGVPSGAKSVYLNIATARSTESTGLSVCAGGTVTASCWASQAVSAAPGPSKSTMIIASIGGSNGNQVTIGNSRGNLDVYVDLHGYGFGKGTSGRSVFAPVSTTSAMSNRTIGAHATYTQTLNGVPSGATAVSLDLSAASASVPTYVAACPGEQDTNTCSATSLLNVTPGANASNSVVVKLGGSAGNQVKFFNNSGLVALNATVRGYYVPLAAPAAAAPPPALVPAAAGGKPGADNTGVPSGTTLKRHDGDLVITTAGTVIDSLDIRGFVSVKAPNVTIKRSIIRGGSSSTGRALVNTSSGASLTIQDSEIFPISASPYLNGLSGGNITARRLDIHDVIDSVRIGANNVSIESSWLHNNAHFNNDPVWGGKPSHDDGIQIERGSNIRIVGNTINGAFNAGIMITQNSVLTSNVTIESNWIDYGGCSVNLNQNGRGPFQGMAIKYNRFGTSQRASGCAIVSPTSTALAAAGNVWDATGAPVQIRRGS